MRHPVARVLALLALASILPFAAAQHASAAKGGKGGGGGGSGGGGSSPLIVSLGDSYISGEAGRWAGNSLDNSGSRGGTDRAYDKRSGTYDPARVYLGGTASNGCHRSDVADINMTGIAAVTPVNLACSGATTANVISAANGGTAHNGEPPQADQLAQVAAGQDVAMVVLSIGGNDLGFSDIIIACTENWFTSPSWWPDYCYDEQQPNVDAAMPAAMDGVRTAIADIRAALAAAGHAPGSYRFVLRSYPSPIPRGSENRYSESGWDRWDYGGCPFWNADSDWARDSLVPQIADNLAAVAASEGVEFLDERDMLQGREVCAQASSHSNGRPSGSKQEWVRWLNTGLVQGDAQESMHPNAYGQEAAGTCLGLLYAAGPGDFACTPIPGAGPNQMALTPI